MARWFLVSPSVPTLSGLGELDNLLGDKQDVHGPAGLCRPVESWGRNGLIIPGWVLFYRALSRWSGTTMKALSVLALILLFLSKTDMKFYIKNKAAAPPVGRHCCLDRLDDVSDVLTKGHVSVTVRWVRQNNS